MKVTCQGIQTPHIMLLFKIRQISVNCYVIFCSKVYSGSYVKSRPVPGMTASRFDLVAH